MDWSEDQKKVIEASGSDILVSAAAGSGKTAVMVERIIRLISDPEKSVSLDSLVVMTFTNAAAAGMRDRIRRALDESIAASPENRKLLMERSLLPRASISTIHSFCQDLIRQHTEELDIEPDFRLADEGEARLMQRDAMDMVFEELYSVIYEPEMKAPAMDQAPSANDHAPDTAREDRKYAGEEGEADAADGEDKAVPVHAPGRLYYLAPGFRRLMDTFNVRTMEMKTADIIELIYKFLMGRPSPESYIEEALRECDLEISGDYTESSWYMGFMEDMKEELSARKELLSSALSVCSSEGGPLKYQAPINECIALAEELMASGGYGELCQRAQRFTRFMTLPRRTKKDDYDPAKQAYVRGIRDDFKEYITKLKKSFLQLDEEELGRSTAGAADTNKTFLLLAREFMAEYGRIKREKNVLDFDDLEHKALKLLYTGKDPDGTKSADAAEGGRTGTGDFAERFRPSGLADSLAGTISEIMIDEYQDSSEVQEALINALSAGRFGRNDVFMVGDVKQSIYRFRNADPGLFISKLTVFSPDAGAPGRRIELSANFRSRSTVLDCVNDVFDRVMTAGFGGIEYDEQARLRAGARFPEYADAVAELMLLDTGGEEEEDSTRNGGQEDYVDPGGLGTGEKELTAEELEYKLIAMRIHSLVNRADPEAGYKVRDALTGLMRPASYGDIAVLVRTRRAAARLREILEQNRIPAYFEESEGYFGAAEVDMMLCLLGIIDNPMQDIPLAAVLRGPIGDFDDSELALIRAAYARTMEKGTHTEPGDFYKALKHAAGAGAGGSAPGGNGASGGAYGGESESEKPGSGDKDGTGPGKEGCTGRGDEDRTVIGAEGHTGCGEEDRTGRGAKDKALIDDGLREKSARFLDMTEELRELAGILPVHELLGEIYARTGWYDLVSAMPGGAVKRKNLDMLLEKAESFGNTNYQGLFNFIRYIEALKKHGQDHGEASAVSENDDIVRINTIHKSKGLEYPIVFLARAGASFVSGRNGGGVVIDRHGPGSDFVDPVTNIKYPGLKKAFIKKLQADGEKAEEQRLLYVAMTRAMEKLIITASGRDIMEKTRSLADKAGIALGAAGSGGKLPVSMVRDAKSYLDWIIMSQAAGNSHIRVTYYDMDYMRGSAYLEAYEETEAYTGTVSRTGKGPGAGDGADERADLIADKLKRIFSTRYAHEAETLLKPKLSVSEIKAMDAGTAYSAEPADYDDEVIELDDGGYPAVKASGEKGTPAAPGGTSRGTAFHRAMELTGFEGTPEEELERLMEDPRFSGQYKKMLDRRAFRAFLGSGLAGRMKKAAEAGRLHREQHFMAGFPARTLIPEQDSDELQILQGVIDAWFEEDGEIVVADYKTDRVSDPEELVRRYRVQLELYGRALSQLTGKNIKESVIYSTFLDREIVL